MEIKVSSKLRELRREAGLTQHETAEKLGISDGAYAMYETGDRAPRDDIKYRIGELFHKPVGYIFYDEPLTTSER